MRSSRKKWGSNRRTHGSGSSSRRQRRPSGTCWSRPPWRSRSTRSRTEQRAPGVRATDVAGDVMPHPALIDYCKRGHPRNAANVNKWGQCRACANLIRRKGKTYPTHCKRGHDWIPGQRRCLICRDDNLRAHSRRQIQDITDCYVKNSIKWPDAPKEIIEIGRIRILLKREMRKRKEGFNGN